MPAPPVDAQRAMDTARHAVLAASAASLHYWSKDVVVDMKPDRSPVTAGELKALQVGSRAEGVRSLIAGAASARCYGDVAGCIQLLNGRAEAWLEAGVRRWDIAALKVLVEEAGGRFTDFDGGPRFLETGPAVASNSLLHMHVLRALAPAAKEPLTPPGAGNRPARR